MKNQVPPPPRLPLKFLRWFCSDELLEDVEGDLYELFEFRYKSNPKTAKWKFVFDVLHLFRPGIVKNFSLYQIHTPMLFNHIKTAVRQSVKHKGYTLLNLCGLIVGLASCISIVLFIQDEVGVDRFHEKSDRIYQVFRNMHQGNGDVNTTPGIPQPLEDVLRNEYPEIEDVTLLSWEMNHLFRLDENTSWESGRYASKEFFDVFSYKFLAGDPVKAFNNIHSVVISEKLAKKYFGDNWRSTFQGKSFKINEQQEYEISGVFESPGTNSSLVFDWISPVKGYVERNEWVRSWGNGSVRIFLTTREGTDIENLRNKVVQEVNKHTNNSGNEEIYLQLFAENHLHSIYKNGLPAGGRIQYIRILTIIAVFVLLVACINFVNLATARANMRAKEIGVRKVLGANHGSLGQQFFIESFLLSIIGVVISVGLVYLVLPYLNTITGKSLHIDLTTPEFWSGIVMLILVTGILSGGYPALLLSSYNAIASLKGKFKQGPTGILVRNGLVTFQFVITIILISGTFVASKQMNYILTKNLGLDKENLVMLETSGELKGKNQIFKNELIKIPQVKHVTFSSGNPISYGASTGGANWDGKNPDEAVEINVLTVDAEFFETMNIEFVEGKKFMDNEKMDSASFIVNEVLADIMGFKSPVDQRLSVWGTDGKVIGVVRNFHMGSMYEQIPPLIIRYEPRRATTAFIKAQLDTQEALKEIERVAKKLNPAYPFQYEFMNEEYAETYRSEISVSTLVIIFCVISIVISCLGLFGLSSLAASQRAKELGIRKVQGASVFQLVLLQAKNFAWLMIIAFLIGAPLSYFLMQKWLNTFAFRANIDLLLFFFAGMIAFATGAITISFKAIQAASVNPIKTLKEE